MITTEVCGWHGNSLQMSKTLCEDIFACVNLVIQTVDLGVCFSVVTVFIYSFFFSKGKFPVFTLPQDEWTDLKLSHFDTVTSVLVDLKVTFKSKWQWMLKITVCNVYVEDLWISSLPSVIFVCVCFGHVHDVQAQLSALVCVFVLLDQCYMNLRRNHPTGTHKQRQHWMPHWNSVLKSTEPRTSSFFLVMVSSAWFKLVLKQHLSSLLVQTVGQL